MKGFISQFVCQKVYHVLFYLTLFVWVRTRLINLAWEDRVFIYSQPFLISIKQCNFSIDVEKTCLSC